MNGVDDGGGGGNNSPNLLALLCGPFCKGELGDAMGFNEQEQPLNGTNTEIRHQPVSASGKFILIV